MEPKSEAFKLRVVRHCSSSRLGLVSLLLLISLPAPGRGAKPKPAIWQVDRILVQTADPRGLFDLFVDRLQLPIAWPVGESAGQSSGGVGAGNVTIELFQSYKTDGLASRLTSRDRFAGVALEPYPLKECLPELESRGIICGTPQPYISKLPDGSDGALWTTVVLPQLSRPQLSVFLYEYSKEFLKTEVRRKQLAGQLALRGGGPLGIKSVEQIVIGAIDPGRDRRLWRKLLEPIVPSSRGLLQAGAGPAVHLVPDTEDRIRSIVIRVASLGQAREFLKGNRWLGAASKFELSMKPAVVRGLDIRFTQ